MHVTDRGQIQRRKPMPAISNGIKHRHKGSDSMFCHREPISLVSTFSLWSVNHAHTRTAISEVQHTCKRQPRL